MVKPSHRGIKTTVEIPENLWRAAKHRALDDNSDLRGVIVTALEKHLRAKAKEPKSRDRRRKENRNAR
jgi:hypothetical protein